MNFGKLVKIIFLILLLSGCASSSLQPALKELGLVRYQPDAYEDLMNDPGIVSSEDYARCVKRIEDLTYDFYSLTYKSEGQNVKAIVALPPNFDSQKKYPLLVFNRGGNRNFGYMYACYFKMLQWFAETVPNSVLVVPQYRGSHGSEGQDEFGGKDVQDILNLIEWSKSAKFISSDQHYLAGWSRGGMMSYLVMKSQAKFKAAAVIAGTTDLFKMEKIRPEMADVHSQLIPNYKNQRKKLLQERSAIYWPQKINTPLLIIHGTEDWRVSVEGARKMNVLLTKNKKIHKYVEYPGEGHDLDNALGKALDEIEAWFALYK